MLAMLSGLLVPVFSAAGIGRLADLCVSDQRIYGKRSVVATAGIVRRQALHGTYPLAAATLLSIQSAPAVAAIASVRRELGGNGPLPWYFLAVSCGMGGSLFGTWNRMLLG